MEYKDESSPTTILIRIKSSNLPSDLTLPVSSSLSVSQLKQSIQQSLGQSASGRYIRLIHSGRLLAPDDAPIDKFKLHDGSVIHVVIAAAGVSGGQQAELSMPERIREEVRRRRRNGELFSLRGAGIGEDGLILSRGRRERVEGTEETEDEEEDLEAGLERMGFDRLRANGLTSSEISALRVYFSTSVDRFIEQRNPLRENRGGDDGTGENHRNRNNRNPDNNNENEDDDMDPDATARTLRLRMEDEWMEMQGPHSEFRLNLNANNPLIQRRMYMNSTRPTGMDPMYTGPLGTDRDFIWGFVLGYFIGFMMMFWVSVFLYFTISALHISAVGNYYYRPGINTHTFCFFYFLSCQCFARHEQVWIPTVPHRQKLGILTGICFHMGMNIINGGTLDAEDIDED
jgi:hypothetical protein